MDIHELKILPRYFEDILHNGKNFEIRRNDRDFKVGDILILKEFISGEYTGRMLKKQIKYILNGDGTFGLNSLYCILSIEDPDFDLEPPLLNEFTDNNG